MEFSARLLCSLLSVFKLAFCACVISTPLVFADTASKTSEDIHLRGTNSVVQVLAYKGETLLNQGSGVVIATGGIVVTSAHLLENSDNIIIQSANGLNNNAIIVSKVDFNDVAVLRSSNLAVDPIDISLSSASNEDVLEVAGYWQLELEKERGSFFDFGSRPKFIAQIIAKKQLAKALMNTPEGDAGSLKHITSIIGRGGYGAPLTNHCGELLGIVRPNKDKTLKQLWQPHVPSRVVVTDFNVLIKILGEQNISVKRADQPCLSVMEQQKLAQTKKQAEIDRAKKKTKQAKKEADKALKQVEKEKKAREEAEKGRSDITSIVSDINAKAEELDAENSDVKKENETLFWFVIAAIAVAILIILMLVVKRKKDLLSAKEDLEAASAAFGDCRFEGVDSLGAPVAFFVLGKDLMQRKNGLVVGRNPDLSQVVIADDTVSRQHARLQVDGKHLCIVDLDSTGGTHVNGQSVGDESVIIISGDSIQVGDVQLNIVISGVE